MTATATQEDVINGTLVSFLKNIAGKYGLRTALLFKPVFRYQRWSYERLWEEAGRVATLLQQRGIKKVTVSCCGDPTALNGYWPSLGVCVPVSLRCP